MLKEANYHVVSPDGQTVLFLDHASARDLVKNAGWTWAKDKTVIDKVSKAEAEGSAFVNGNDPKKLDVDAIQAMYDNEGDWLDTLSKDELVAEAKNRGIDVDKRWGRDRLITEIRKTIDSGAEDE